MSAALLHLKELAVLLCDHAATLPRSHRWQQPWASACRMLLERDLHGADRSLSVACRVSAWHLTTGLPHPNLYFAPNLALQSFLRAPRVPQSTAASVKQSLGSPFPRKFHPSTAVYAVRLSLQNNLAIMPGLQPRSARCRRMQHIHPPLHAADLATFTSDARRRAPADDSDPPQPKSPPSDSQSQDANVEDGHADTSATVSSLKDSDLYVSPAPPLPSDSPPQDHTPISHIDSQQTGREHQSLPKSRLGEALPGTDSKNVFAIPDGVARSTLPQTTQFGQPRGRSHDPVSSIAPVHGSASSQAQARAQHPNAALHGKLPFQLQAFKRQLMRPSPEQIRDQKVRRALLIRQRKDGRRIIDVTNRLELRNPGVASQSGALWLVWDEAVRAGLGARITITEEMRLAEWLEAYRPLGDTAALRNLRGQRIKKLLDRVEERTLGFRGQTPLQGYYLLYECLRIYQYSLLDDWHAVQTSLHDLLLRNGGVKEDLGEKSNLPIVNLIRFLLQDAVKYDNPLRVLEIVLDNFVWMEPAIRRYEEETWSIRGQWYHQSKYLQYAVDKAITMIARPVELLDDKLPLWNNQRLRRCARLLLQCSIRQNKPEIAYAIYLWQRRNQIYIPWHDLADLTDLLALRESYAEAEGVFRRLIDLLKKMYPKETKWKLKAVKTALRLAAHQGDVDAAETYYHELEDRCIVRKEHLRNIYFTPGEQALRMHAYAVAGRTEDLEAVFTSMFPPENREKSPRRGKPWPAHYSELILAYARRGDLESANKWLSEMTKAGYSPHQHIYNTILGELANRGDVDAVRSVLEQMRRANIERDHVTYLAVINLYATVKDPLRASQAFEQALQDGIRPNAQLFNRLLNAHVEAASWPGVIRLFDYVMNLPYRTLRLSISLCNILLKAYVMIGAPHYAVRGVFARLAEFGAIPNMPSYCLLVQSAVDSGRMAEADRIFRQMQSALNLKPSDPVNVYPLSMLVAGHLRRGEHEEARARYNEMIENDIQPSTTTFAAIIRSHASAETEDGLRIAEEFLKQVLDNPGERNRFTQPRNPADTLSYLFIPLMNAHAVVSDSSEVERVYAEFLEKGGISTISSLSILLLAYGRSGDTDAVVQVWEEIHKLGLQLLTHESVFHDAHTEDTLPGGTNANWLAYALSIYINSLSLAGRHTTIAETLALLRKEGFVFNANNWNHIAVAMMRAGEPERAFEVVERVILRYRAESERLMRNRDMHPESPLLPKQPKDEDAPEILNHPALGAKERQLRVFRTEQAVPYPGADIKGEDQIGSIEDLVHSLYILHQVSPAWHIWKPYPHMLQVLGAFLDPETRHEVDLGLSKDGASEEVLRRIYTNYPAAVAAVTEQQRRRQRRRPESPRE
ncbi:hypothetical protein CALCODRAFT_445225 [Calocera cornea HHB12733]|uniref:Pentacotripeptide-repeat region of PRORP domain-containing protein n=1 Tax=Calocera cornea HHB12733 TaxID=1353952 RepID=A0A165K7N4_9BASI|nr:hypothetical protein CALCODRAFT_445225 [Calocera cornea HHB12733]